MDDPGPPEGPQRGARTNLFFAATLHWPRGDGAVRVRNLSATGAMIESDWLLTAEDRVTLERGPLAMSGLVVWVAGKRAGLRFDRGVDVRLWMAPPGKAAPGSIERVTAAPLPAVTMRESGAVTAADLALARRLVDALTEALATDPALVARHGGALQSLDLLDQLLAGLGEVAAGRGAALDHLRSAARAVLDRG